MSSLREKLQAEIDLRDALLVDAQVTLLTQVDRQKGIEAEVQLRDTIIEKLRGQLPLWRKAWARITRSSL